MPFAFACRSGGTSSVTVVDSAMLRRFSTTDPSRMTPANIQNHGPPMSARADSGCARYSPPATRNAARVAIAETTITRCLRCRSTTEPNSIENRATSSMYVPPTIPVASTERVSRYTQKVSANQR